MHSCNRKNRGKVGVRSYRGEWLLYVALSDDERARLSGDEPLEMRRHFQISKTDSEREINKANNGRFFSGFSACTTYLFSSGKEKPLTGRAASKQQPESVFNP